VFSSINMGLTMERVGSPNDVLIDAVPSLVTEAFDLTPDQATAFGLVSKSDHDGLVDEVFRKEPFSDDHRSGWLILLSSSFLGYAIQQKLANEKNISKGDFISALQSQLAADAHRWGNTWRTRPIEGQLERSYAEFTNYKDQYKNAGQPFPWLKVAGDIIIDLYRIDHPDYQK
jgi:hypothetical protein